MRSAIQELHHHLALGMVIGAGLLGPIVSSAGTPGQTTLVCTNPYSGATWKISIDFSRGTVDTNPARIDAAKISWHDRKDGGNYTLDRKSGKLTVIVTSRAGGDFIYDHCKPN